MKCIYCQSDCIKKGKVKNVQRYQCKHCGKTQQRRYKKARIEEGKYKGKKYLSDTWGCMRINDDDMLEIRIITDALEANDPLETKGYLTVKNDLKTPVEYSTNRLNRVNAGLDQIQRKIKPYVFGFILQITP